MAKSIPIAELARVAHPRDSKRRIMALLTAYFDASSTEANSRSPGRVTSLGGYIGADGTWSKVEKEWAANLTLWGLERFHLTRILAGRTESGAANANPDLCALSFAKIIKRSDLHSIHAGLRADEWDAAPKTQEQLARHPRHYHCCLDMLLEILAEHCQLEFPHDDVAVVLDRDEQPGPQFHFILDDWKARNPKFITIDPGDRKRFPILQTADLCAGEQRIAWLAREFPDKPEFHAFSRRYLAAIGRRGRGIFWSVQTQKMIAEAQARVRAEPERRGRREEEG